MNFIDVRKAYRRCTYCRYFLIGSMVGAVAIFAREILASLFPADTPGYYLLSVTLIYIGGIFASYYGHRKITFGHRKLTHVTVKSMCMFTIIAILGLILTAVISAYIRYEVPITGVAERYKPALSFALAIILSSTLTFSLNSIFTFRTPIHSDMPDRPDGISC
jgi:putative flippase GtrA